MPTHESLLFYMLYASVYLHEHTIFQSVKPLITVNKSYMDPLHFCVHLFLYSTPSPFLSSPLPLCTSVFLSFGSFALSHRFLSPRCLAISFFLICINLSSCNLPFVTFWLEFHFHGRTQLIWSNGPFHLCHLTHTHTHLHTPEIRLLLSIICFASLSKWLSEFIIGQFPFFHVLPKYLFLIVCLRYKQKQQHCYYLH